MTNKQSEHYSEGRRWSHIQNAWVLAESWNDREEIASLRAEIERLRSLEGGKQEVASQAETTGEDLRRQLGEIFHIGKNARTNATILMNASNAIRRSDCLGAIERAFFMVPEPGDEGEEPEPVCRLRWNAEPGEYVQQMRMALAEMFPTPRASTEAGSAKAPDTVPLDVGVPEGWKLVPVNSTPEMEWAYRRAEVTYREGSGRRSPMDPHSAFAARYAAILAATPNPPTATMPGATMFHDAGAIAQCQYCKRYTLDRKALGDRQPVCACGKQHGWSGSFKPPGPDAQWHGPAPVATVQADREDAELIVRQSVEGVIEFRRSNPDEQVCVCCPPKTGHIYSRRVKLEHFDTRYPEHFGRGPREFVDTVALERNDFEGKRVRIIVEVFDAARATAAPGDSK